MPTFRSARDCLASVSAHYQTLPSYQDVGVVRRIGTTEPLSCWFETRFLRPTQFRFQFIRPHPYRKLRHLLTKYIAGCDGSVAYSYTEQQGAKPTVEIEENLAMAVAGATGISLGSAHTIGDLLLDCLGGFSLTRLERPRFRRSRGFDGVVCYRISGRHPYGGRVQIWIGVHDLLIRKLIHYRFRHEEVRFKIEVGALVSQELFRVPCQT